jgi:hypothetical protein
VNDFSPQTSHAFLILWNTISVCFMFVFIGGLGFCYGFCTWECQNNFNFYVWTSNFLVGLWIVGPKDLQVRGFLHVDFGCHLCFMMGKVHGWRTYPNCRATLGYCLI